MDIVTYALCMGNDNYILDIVKSMDRLTMVVSDAIPTVDTAEPNKLYLVDTNHDGVYEEYVLAEVQGTQEILELGNITDLSNYYTKAEVDTLLSGVHIQCTPAEYDLLTPEQKSNGAEYFVYDTTTGVGIIYRNDHVFGSSTLAAQNVIYDNTTSELNATTVQAAIDELAAGSGGGSEYELEDTYDYATKKLTISLQEGGNE